MRIEALDDGIRQTALDWTIRVQDANFVDWDGLTAWLQADPRHAEWFDTLTIRDAEAVDLLRETSPPPMPVHPAFLRNEEFGEERPSRGWMRLAAGLAIPVALSGGWFLYGRGGEVSRSAPATIEVATLPAEQRTMTLADGTRIAVAGATRLSIDPAARTAALLAGRATFRVVHDAAHPFSVRLGDVTVTDIGTVFDLRRSEQGADIAVAEGVVRLDGAGGGRRVRAGEIVRLLPDGSLAETAAIVPADVGSWKDGRYDYADTSIAEIAADLTAATGAQVRAAPDIAARRFAGSIRVTGDPDQALHAVAPLLGMSVRKVGAGWELDGPADADRR